MAERGWPKLRKAFDGWLDRSINSGGLGGFFADWKADGGSANGRGPRAQRYDGPIDYMLARRPGTYHLTVNSEGAWTIKVVTAP